MSKRRKDVPQASVGMDRQHDKRQSRQAFQSGNVSRCRGGRTIAPPKTTAARGPFSVVPAASQEQRRRCIIVVPRAMPILIVGSPPCIRCYSCQYPFYGLPCRAPTDAPKASVDVKLDGRSVNDQHDGEDQPKKIANNKILQYRRGCIR